MYVLLIYFRRSELIRLFLFSLFLISNLLSQTWHQTTGINGGIIKSIVKNPSSLNNISLFAGAIGNGVFLSTNAGSSWT